MTDYYNGLLGLIITSAILIAIPGPSIMFFIGQVLTQGRSNALRGVAGNAIGMCCVAIVLSIGLGSLILESKLFLYIIRMLGVIVLLLIGIQYLIAAKGKLSNNKTNLSEKIVKNLLLLALL